MNILCKLLGHKVINEKLIIEMGHEQKTFNANCGRCKSKLFGWEKRGEMSKEIINVYIKI